MPQHLEWHQQRVDATLKKFYPAHHHSWELFKCIQVPDAFLNGRVRCRVEYNAHHIDIHFFEYQPREIKSLACIEVPDAYQYNYKYVDRSVIEGLFEKRNEADDILMLRNGYIMDTSIANIAFEKNGSWYTPSLPLLAGTTWKRLVHEKQLTPRPIHKGDLKEFSRIWIFNAMHQQKVEGIEFI